MFKDLLNAGDHFFNSDLAKAYHELEVSHDELAKTNKVLTVALQELQSAKQSVQANTSLKSPIETRSADLLQIEQRWRSLLEDVAILRDSQNAIIDTMSMSKDITERLEVDRLKGEFISVISHELRTPLTAIHGSLELLTGDLVSSESDRGKQLLHLAADSARQLVRLVDDILEMERLESGKALFNKERVDTRSITHRISDTFQIAASKKGITLNVFDPGLFLMADGDRLIQVLTNLLDNAVKFSADNTTIWLSVEPKAGEATDTAAMALFKVRDQGRGIPSEHLSEIFGRFTQVNHSDSREKGGTGLGLAICQNIIEQHDGSIWVESELDKGSCFQFTIPSI